MEHLADALADPEGHPAQEEIRAYLHKIVVMPTGPHEPYRVEVENVASIKILVAEEGLEPPTRGL